MGYKIFHAIFSLLVFLYQHASATKQQIDELNYAAFRPSDFFQDLEYDLEIFTDVATFSPGYRGSVLITAKCTRETNKIFLDQKFLNINEITIEAWECIEGNNYQKIPVMHGRNVRENDGYKIEFNVNLHENINYKVKLEFSNEINSEYPGFIYTHYRQQDYHLKVKALVYTKMKNHLASHIFPCFNTDEIKAKFRVKIGHLENVNSFTNSKLISRKLFDNPKKSITGLDEIRIIEEENNETLDEIPKIWVLDEFAETGPIEIFSVALAVVDFISDEPTTQIVGPPSNRSAIEIRLWAERDILDFTKGVLRGASKSLAFYSSILEMPYKLGKLDLIVLPDEDIIVEDYYGLIYLGEKVTMDNILSVSYHYEKAYSFILKICLAVGKQWIGHLVPPSKGHESWFQDGLHTYLQRNCVDEAFQDWKLHVQLELIDSFINLLRTVDRGRHYSTVQQLERDSLGYSSALNSETKFRVHLIIRMLRFILEVKENLFQNSLSNYMNTIRGADASLIQVWDSWTRMMNEENEIQILPKDVDFKKFFVSWLGHRGYPIINVARNKAGTLISLTQELFLFPNQLELLRPCWPISFDIISRNEVFSKNEKVRQWITCSSPSPLNIPITDGKKNDWIILSLRLHAPVRVYYDRDGWFSIKELFRNKNEIEHIDVLTRIQILHDMFTFAEVSKLPYVLVFDTIKYISHEKDDKCLNVIFEELRRIRSRWIGTFLFEPFQNFIHTILEPVFRIKVFDIEKFLESGRPNNQLERNILITGFTFELPDCMLYSQNILSKWMKNDVQEFTNSIPDFLQGYLYCLAMINADEDEWNFLMNKYVEKPENTSILEGLGCSSNTRILKNYLRWSLNVKNPNTSAQVGLKVFEILSSRNDQGYDLIRPFFKKRLMNSFNKDARTLKKFIDKFKGDITIVDFLIKAIEGTRNEDDLNMLLKYAYKSVDAEVGQVIDQHEATSVTKRNISWFPENAEKVSEYFTLSSKAWS